MRVPYLGRFRGAFKSQSAYVPVQIPVVTSSSKHRPVSGMPSSESEAGASHAYPGTAAIRWYARFCIPVAPYSYDAIVYVFAITRVILY